MREVERTVKYEAEGFEDLNAALAWVVQTSDSKFEEGATNINIERVYSADASKVDLEWHELWTATVMGEPASPSSKLTS